VIASGGRLLRPQVVREIRDAAGAPVYRFDLGTEPRPALDGLTGGLTLGRTDRAISENTARTMARLLTGVASKEGTAPEAAIPRYEVAGKTGTTQKLLKNAAGRLEYSTTHHVASFVGFFPASNPQVVISVIVDDADAHAPGGIAYGAKVAAPSFKRLGEQLIPYLDIKPAAFSGDPGLLALTGGRP